MSSKPHSTNPVEDPKQALGKRTHTESDASLAGPSEAAVVPAKKRVRPTPAPPRATSTGGQDGHSGHMFVYSCPSLNHEKLGKLINHRDFTAAMFTCQLGKDGPELKAHEFALKRSPVFVQAIQKARTNKRVAKHEFLCLMAHDKTAFEQMLSYLYRDKFQMSKNKSTSIFTRLDELKELMSLAKYYKLPDLQKQVVQVFKASKLVTQIPRAKFFDWAEDMYYEELDHKNGPFKIYMSIAAPDLLKGMDDECKRSLASMVNQGGGFAEQLFIAATTVSPSMLSGLFPSRD